MCGGTGTGASGVAANNASEYIDKPKNEKHVTISVLFSPFSYDEIKKHAGWEMLNEFSFDYYHYYIYRFVTLLKYTTNEKVKNNTQSLTKENVAAAAKKKAPAETFDKAFFIDCGSEKGENASYSDRDFIQYLSLVISEIKDYLFRIRLNNPDSEGTVDFVLAAYQPMQHLMYALESLLGHNSSKCDEYSDYIGGLHKNAWFSGLTEWLEGQHWKVKIKECTEFEGYYYGICKESRYSFYMKRVEAFDKYINKMEPFFKTSFKDSWISDWKDSGELSTDQTANGKIATDDNGNYILYRKGQGIGSSTLKDMTVGMVFDEVPVGEVYGDYYTLAEMKHYRKLCEEEAFADVKAPKWRVSAAPKNSKKVDEYEIASSTAKEMQKELDEWKKASYDPQMKDIDGHINKIDDRQGNTLENQVWQRKKNEDEAISDQWNADINTVEYHGKTVNRDELVKQKTALENEYNRRQKAIKELKNYADEIYYLKLISFAQFTLGILSFGVASPLALGAIVLLDIILEVGKIAIEYHYEENYKINDAIERHWKGILNDTISIFLLLPRIKIPKGYKPSLKSIVTSPLAYKKNLSTGLKDWFGNTKGILNEFKLSANNQKHFQSQLHLVKGLKKMPQSATFMYTAQSTYDNFVYAFQPHELALKDAKALDITSVDGVKAEDLFDTSKVKNSKLPSGAVQLTNGNASIKFDKQGGQEVDVSKRL